MVEDFRGNNPEALDILNAILRVIHYTRCDQAKDQEEKVSAVLYLGHKQMYAINCVEYGDLAIERDLKTMDVKMHGWPIIPVMVEDYACATVAVNLKMVTPSIGKKE